MRSRPGNQSSDQELELRQVEYQEIEYHHASETSNSAPRARLEILNESTTYVTPNTTATAEFSMLNLLIDNLPGPRTVLGGLRWIASPRQALSNTLAKGRLTTVEEEQPVLMTPSAASASVQTSSSELPPPLPRRRYLNTGRAEVANSGNSTTTESVDQYPAPIDLNRYMPDLALVRGVVSGVSSVANTVRSVAGKGLDLDDGQQGNPAPFNASPRHPEQSSRHQPHQQAITHASRTTQDDSERLMYINGALHILRGLPRDLDPGEIAMLQRAMPPALAIRQSGALQQHHPYGLTPAESWDDHHSDCGGHNDGRRNLVHILVFALLCWLWSAAEAVVPWAAAAGRRAAHAEHEHGYLPRLMVAASRLLLALVELSRRVCLLRHAAAARLAAAAVRPAQLSSSIRASSAALSISRASSSPLARRPAAVLARFYSAAAPSPAQPSSDASSEPITRFADLPKLGVSDSLVRSITQGMGYENMTPIQAMTINAALAGKDVVAQAKTGTGKTLAFLTPVVQRILNRLQEENPNWRRRRPDARDVQAIIISPTRELAEQISAEAKKLCQGTGVVVQTAVGGTMKRMMLGKARREGCHLLVATPGRLYDLLSDPESGISAPRLASLVLDEADRMLEVGFSKELEQITELLPSRNEVPRQTLLYSATLPKDVVGIARQYIDPKNFEFVQTVRADETPTHERVPQYIVPCRSFQNLAPSVLDFMRNELTAAKEAAKQDPDAAPFKAIVFLPTTAAVLFYTYLFQRVRYHDRRFPMIYDMHSKLSQATRTKNSDAFRNARSAILFSSDVAARGMDFPNVSHVVQVHLPQDRDIYIHRIGRTGRAGKGGQAYLFVSNIEINAARKRLPGLPIQRCTTIESAEVDVSDGAALPPAFQDIREACSRAPHEVLKNMYTSLLGNSLKGVEVQSIIDELNEMSKKQWGMEEPPAVSRKLLNNLPRGLTGLNILSESSHRLHRGDSDRRGGFGDRGFGGRRDSQPRRFRDDFERMEYMAGQKGDRRGPRPQPTF
ncbi:hypothetical protein VTJ49DRAFT_3898 [Mycothermus thermophilus]|uniref:ATP-dependent RNA helicase n=1 Tax=Humicola insolens TaxID=85995 RepID=A0ABR3VPJ8_HUMIN